MASGDCRIERCSVPWAGQDFAYRIDQGVMTFVFGIMTTLFLAFITICSQTIKAARANPVETLRYE